MKKLTSLLLVLFLTVALTACGGGEKTVSEPQEPEAPPSIDSIIRKAELQYPASNEQFKYNVYDTYVEITEYIGDDSAKEVIVPATLDELPVYVIDFNVFNKSEVESIIFEEGIYNIRSGFSGDLKKVSLPSTLNYVGFAAFKNCYALEEVIIPEGIDSIQSQAFKSCSSLKEIKLPSTVTRIDREVFAYCTKLEKVVLPEGVTAIDDEAFVKCGSLKSITLPSALESIGEGAFHGVGLESIEIPANVKKVEGGLFTACKNLKKVVVHNAELEIVPTEGYSFSLLFSQCNPDLVVCGKPGSTIAKACARENIFFEVMK